METIDIKAMHYAIAKHESVNQMYGKHPYTYHLSSVASVLMKYREVMPADEFPLILAGAWCHDLIEDVHSITYNDIKQALGYDVAEIVYACTEVKGRNREERHGSAFFECLIRNKYGVIVKLADWIANVEESIKTDSHMLVSYRKEFRRFRDWMITPAKEAGVLIMLAHLEGLLTVRENDEKSDSSRGI